MDLHPTPFPAGKSQPLRPKTTRKTTYSSRTTANEAQIPRQNRVFGSVRSTNVMEVKSKFDRPIVKPSNGVTKKQPKSTTKNHLPKNDSSLKPRPITSVESPERDVSVVEPRTPTASQFMMKNEVAGTPYHSARNCSKCRFDRLETASYWLGQIKLAELVGKHFVSVAFFRLALDCNAESLRNLRVELKRYMARHGYLSGQTEWKDVCLAYGILKNGSGGEGVNLDAEKSAATGSQNTGGGGVDEEDHKDVKEQPETK